MVDYLSPNNLCLATIVSQDRWTRCFLALRADLLQFLSQRARRTGAEDLVQEVWLRLRERSDPASWREPRAFIFTTAAHLATDARRREARADTLFSSTAEPNESPCPRADPEAQADATQRVERLNIALGQLPSVCREAFLMYRLDGLTHAEIAATLGISTKSVQRYIARALRHCLNTAGR